MKVNDSIRANEKLAPSKFTERAFQMFSNLEVKGEYLQSSDTVEIHLIFEKYSTSISKISNFLSNLEMSIQKFIVKHNL